MTNDDIEKLVAKFLSGETSIEEESRLSCEIMRNDAPQHWRIVSEMLGTLTLDAALYDCIVAKRVAQKRAEDMPRTFLWKICRYAAASIALLAVIGTSVWYHMSQQAKTFVAHVDNLQEVASDPKALASDEEPADVAYKKTRMGQNEQTKVIRTNPIAPSTIQNVIISERTPTMAEMRALVETQLQYTLAEDEQDRALVEEILDRMEQPSNSSEYIL